MTAVVEMLQSLIASCNGVTLVDYFLKSMHYSIAESSNMVTNFMGTAFLLSIIWGFISDSYITRFTTFVISGILQLLVWKSLSLLINILVNNNIVFVSIFRCSNNNFIF
jgi:peptide/histidine transporter 3/4